MSDQAKTSAPLSPPLVALAGLLLPGAGYVAIGQRAHGITVGLTVILLFVMGLLIGGIRVVEVPGYDDLGRPIMIPGNFRGESTWILYARPLVEIVNKPWFVPQAMTGPVGLIAANLSVRAAQPAEDHPREEGTPHSHSRVAEIGTLYTAVAGMLNLMAIIDSAYRASREGRR